MSVVEVDQSGKFENTKQDTVLAFSNGIRLAVLIPAQVKRDCVLSLRGTSAPKTCYTQLFATGLYFLLRHHIERLSAVVIDIEYQGKESQIKQHVLHLLRRSGYVVRSEQIGFGLIGKQSQAHFTALSVFRGDAQPDLKLTHDDLIGAFRTKRKNRGLP